MAIAKNDKGNGDGAEEASDIVRDIKDMVGIPSK